MIQFNIWTGAITVFTVYALSSMVMYQQGFSKGSTSCVYKMQLAQIEEQKKLEDRLEEQYKKVDKDTPYHGDDADRLGWLLKNAHRGT